MTASDPKRSFRILIVLSLSQEVSAPVREEEKQKNYELAEKLLSEQSFPAALSAGAVATILGAAAYGIAVAKWPFSYGFAAAGAGIVIGLAMGFLGRGISMKFAVAAALYTIACCVLSNMFWAMMNLALATGISPIEVLQSTPVSALARQAVSYGISIVLVYWFVAVILAIFLARRPLTRSQRLAVGLYEMRG